MQDTMTRKKTRSSIPPDPPGDAPQGKKREQYNIRLPEKLRTQLEILAHENLTDLSDEIIAACLDKLRSKGLWPVPGQPKRD